MFRKFRILILLLILSTVALGGWRASSRLAAWEHSIYVALYPIAADNSPATQAYIATLDNDSFENIGHWIQQESQRYGKSVLQPVVVRVAPPLKEMPPLPPPPPASPLDTIVWSLKLRWWASQNDAIAGPKPDVRLFVLYHTPENNRPLPHSTGLSKGQLGLIHAFASPRQQEQNAVVITHELLHTFGASDKYDLASTLPIYPHGYADPEKSPLLPQTMAEIMGGRIPRSEQRADIPNSLQETLIGPESAREIGLLSR